ncbi:MAG TPA: hypothetical protein VHP38_10840 [Ruminiclostridium sp.]|nr:hypothetical protein [Ruminiclostridium sp.]
MKLGKRIRRRLYRFTIKTPYVTLLLIAAVLLLLLATVNFMKNQ